MTALNGEWILESSENFDDFMKELGISIENMLVLKISP